MAHCAIQLNEVCGGCLRNAAAALQGGKLSSLVSEDKSQLQIAQPTMLKVGVLPTRARMPLSCKMMRISFG